MARVFRSRHQLASFLMINFSLFLKGRDDIISTDSECENDEHVKNTHHQGKR